MVTGGGGNIKRMIISQLHLHLSAAQARESGALQDVVKAMTQADSAPPRLLEDKGAIYS